MCIVKGKLLLQLQRTRASRYVMPQGFVCSKENRPCGQKRFVARNSPLSNPTSSRQAQPNRLIWHIAIECRWFLSNEVPEVQSNFRKHLRMLLGPLHALGPRLAPVLGAAELSCQDDIEGLNLFLGPLDTGTHHGRRETTLEAAHRVLDNCKVHEGYLPDVEVQVSLEDTLAVTQVSKVPASFTFALINSPRALLDDAAPRLKICLSRAVLVPKPTKPADVLLSLAHFAVRATQLASDEPSQA